VSRWFQRFMLWDEHDHSIQHFDSFTEAVLNAKHRAGPDVVFQVLPHTDVEWHGWASKEEMDDDEDGRDAMFYLVEQTIYESDHA